jgi:hypothetical protein
VSPLSSPCSATHFPADSSTAARPVQQPGIGGEHHVLGLHRGIDDHPDSSDGLIALVLMAIERLSWSSACSRSSPMRLRHQRRTIEHQPVLEEVLAAEVLYGVTKYRYTMASDRSGDRVITDHLR